MHPHLNYILAQQRIADLQRAAEHARLATDARTRQRESRYATPIVRALPMPTAHPSPEAWSAAQRAARSSRAWCVRPALEGLRGKGVTIITEPHKQQFGGWLAAIGDPDGYPIQRHQPDR